MSFPEAWKPHQGQSCRMDFWSLQNPFHRLPFPRQGELLRASFNQATSFRSPGFSQQDPWNHPERWWPPGSSCILDSLLKSRDTYAQFGLHDDLRKSCKGFKLVKLAEFHMKIQISDLFGKIQGLATPVPLSWATTLVCLSSGHPMFIDGNALTPAASELGILVYTN